MSEQTPPAKDQKKVLPLEHQSYALHFALTGFILVIVSLWAIWDETYARRPWKDYQQEFVKAAKPVYQERLANAKKELEKKSSDADYYSAWNLRDARFPANDPAFSATVAKIKSTIPEVKGAAGPDDLLNKLRAERTSVDKTIAIKRKDFQLKRGRFAAAVWQYESEPTNASAKATIDQLQKPIDEAAEEIRLLDLRRKTMLDAEAELLGPAGKAEAKLAEYEKDVAGTSRAMTALDNETISVRQNFNIDLGPNGQIDRCESCHLGADRPGLDKLNHPYKTHSGDWLKTHPKEKFGCVSCHQGDGIATISVADAHGEDPFWLNPMLPGKMMQAACYKCHETQVKLKGADTLMAGKRLFREVGCIGCHKIRGIGDDEAELVDVKNAISTMEQDAAALEARAKSGKAEDVKALAKAKSDLELKRLRQAELDREVKQVGPDLTGLKGKVAPGFIEAWLRDPRKFRPTTRMPRFWPEPTAHEETKRNEILAQQQEEIRAITAYLWENSTDKVGKVTLPPSDAAAVARGKNIVDTIGCKGCHNVDADDAKLLGGRRFGPELSRVGEKIRPEWIAAWVKNPKALMPHSKMPNLRLSDAQAADVAAYLSTQKSKDLWPTEFSDGLKDDAARQGLVKRGETLIKHYGCFGCHTIKGMETQGRIGVELTVEGSKSVEEFDYGLLEHAMKAPYGGAVWENWFKQRVGQPALDDLKEHDPKARIDPHSRPNEWQAWLKKYVDKNTLDIVGQFFRPYRGTNDYHLSREGYLATKMANPRVFDTGKVKKAAEQLKMPDFGLEPEELFAITTFILGNTADIDALKAPWKDKPTWPRSAIIDGQRIIERSNCQGCHRFERNLSPTARGLIAQMVHGFDAGKKIEDQKAPKFQELDAQTVLSRMSFLKPGFALKAGDANSEKTLWNLVERATLEGDVYPLHRKVQMQRAADKAAAKKAAPAPVKKAGDDDDDDEDAPEELADSEQLMGFNPPTLYYQGERAKPDWLFGFLKQVETLRPWLEIRMPTFDFSDGDTRKLVAYFAAHGNVDYPYQTPVVQTPDAATMAKAGKILESCLACHQALPPNPSADLVVKSAPDLGLAHRRLRADWMASWILDPESYLPGTRMPQMFAYHGNMYADFADGDAVKQSRAMAAYLTTYKAGQAAPTGTTTGTGAPGAAPAMGETPAPAATPAPGASPAAPAPAPEATPAPAASPAAGASPAAAAPAAAPAAAAPAVEEKASDADKGTVKGIIKFEGAAPKMKKVRMDAEASCKAHHESAGAEVRDETVVVNADGTLKNVFVYLKGAGIDDKEFPVPAEPVVLDQRGCQYIPHVWGVQVGQALKILNSDTGVLHNIHTFSEKGQGFNKGMPGAPGVTLEEHFANTEVMVKVKCDVHGWMQGFCGVLKHPFYSVSGDKGSFYIRNVPPGDYELEAWHEKYGSQTFKVSVKAGGTAEQAVSFKGE